MSESRGTNTTSIRSIRSISAQHTWTRVNMKREGGHSRDDVNAHLAFGSFNGGVGLSWWDRVSFAEDLNWKECSCTYEEREMRKRPTLKWWISDSILSFIDARGGGTILWSSTLIAPVGILLRHCKYFLRLRPMGQANRFGFSYLTDDV